MALEHTERKLLGVDVAHVYEDDSDSIDEDSNVSKLSARAKIVPLRDIVHPTREAIEKGIKATENPIKIVWKDVKFSTRVLDIDAGKGGCGKKPMKTLDILKGCSGSAMPG